ncbi:RlmE family RNA methyltransferase [Candidatus Woesearchaeota archaeon]|nr:RlmE family RNA methyltransferase [Candidatus Woesearchaeota archaeon]
MRDKHTLRAWREGFLGRAIYKLKEINNRYNIIKKGNKVLDLGCYPGSWVQYLLDTNCEVWGIDVKEVKNLKFKFINKDVYDDSIFEKLDNNFDVIVSDLAPKTTGIKDLDQERSLDLCYRALEIAKKVLKKNGNLLVKIFDNNRLDEYVKEVKNNFSYVKIFKPKVSKKRSKEIYIIAKSKQNL